MSDRLMAVAAAFDRDEPELALKLLTEGDFRSLKAAGRVVLLGLWRRAYTTEGAGHGLDRAALLKVIPLFEAMTLALRHQEIWPLFNLLDTAETLIGSPRLAALVTSVLWDFLPSAHYALQYEAVTRSFLGGDREQFQNLFSHMLSTDKGFVPDFWQTQSLIRVWAELGHTNPEARIAELLKRCGREDLAPLVQVYVLLVLQTRADEGYRLAGKLEDNLHRARMASYLLGASQTEKSMARAVKLHHKLTSAEESAERDFMRARLALAEGDWGEVARLTEGILHNARLKNEAICLRALAHVHLGDPENARAAIDHVRHNAKAAWFLKARADLINVALRLVADGVPLPNDVASPPLALSSGKPLAQSLWIGPRLRWIEEMSIASYLRNGWRYQLYTYETPENLPDGVELMDASAILPRSEIFVEGATSGMHKGSVGAFSDLFRYAMISARGGMWTDTDVLNIRAFEPDGARFISTERSDAGLIGLNGAMMAAPAQDALQVLALRRSQELLETGGLHFARIGPELLAELIGDGGLQGYTLLPTDFLNPLGWMETGHLLRPFDEVAPDLASRDLFNIHVYTETWRLIGLSLKAPPAGDGFLAVLYDRLMNEPKTSGKSVMDLMRVSA